MEALKESRDDRWPARPQHIVAERPRACVVVRRARRDGPRAERKNQDQFSFVTLLCRPGDYIGVAAPDPIPNSAVKRPGADGTPS